MRTIISLNTKWAFTKEADTIPTEVNPRWNFVNLPHTWNGIDGQDGNNDYYRGRGTYAKHISKKDLPDSPRYYLELNGANASADVYWNGRHLAHHDGGYSAFRVDVSDAMAEENLLVITVDNGINETVYPQNADFTFYGGLYRDVNLICVPESHFDLLYAGGPGIHVTPTIHGEDAQVEVKTWTTDLLPGQQARITLSKPCGCKVAEALCDGTATLTIPKVHLWHGRKDPYLYTATAELLDPEGTVLDNVTARFGCRTFEIHPEKGFFLNGKSYPLHGVCRHQDRWGIGNALLPEHHREDMALICEVGANTIRLAHYQQSQYFYDLCDEKGMIVWAEIPYISRHMPNGRSNTLSQMEELIVQSYNHPSIVVWGLSNEVTMMTPEDEDLLENHRLLNDLAHRLDPTRRTTIAVLQACDPDAKYLQIPDAVSWNHYFGWYVGTTDQVGPALDDFHARHPDIPVGCSEYGCEALNWHNSDPKVWDYSEEYQAHFHEEYIKQLFARPYLWATHVWNMFDFGADQRMEGGENGQNHKGLVTIDRKYRKDAFYAYKAWLTDDPFVHICSKRYVDRVEPITRVTVYSNLPEVELFANGVSLGAKYAPDHFFYFYVPNDGETRLTAQAGDCQDESLIRKVDAPNPAYILPKQ